MKKEEIALIQEESLSNSLNTSSTESGLNNNNQIKRFSIQDTRVERKGSLFDCISKCMGIFKKKKESSLLETSY